MSHRTAAAVNVALAAILLLTGCASQRQSAHLATATDAATTAIGVGSGVASEMNPLIGSPAAFVAIMLGRVAATEYVNTFEEPLRTQYLSAMNSIWWGVGASNVVVLALAKAALAAANPIGAAVGLATGIGWWVSTAERREFAAICAAARVSQPSLVCTFSPT